MFLCYRMQHIIEFQIHSEFMDSTLRKIIIWLVNRVPGDQGILKVINTEFHSFILEDTHNVRSVSFDAGDIAPI